ncbi:hypothetical protein [Pseudanabaena sp. FACHB-2040]|uniref:hypothetical protein n=1 Tax=Pseudanabaena sp. FACHB-2040 TaxID=2692859 RepID=UPI0016897CBC|nr:hypothetical protein [Pseudanabaena sp. FACHB-2040]MBD2259443.1 hypothetical protein [Pseudanabaena sp. FACHB-2040]
MTHAVSRQLPSTQFLLKWVLANLLGGFLVGFLENNGLQFAATLLLTGIVLGTLQWWVVRQVVQQVRWWPLASALGWIVGSLILASSSSLYTPPVNALWNQFGLWEVFWLNLITGPIPVLVMALAQALVLGRRVQLVGWLLANLVAGVVEGGVGATLCAAICQPLPTALVGIVSGLAWAAYSVITGAALLWLLKRPQELSNG